MTFCQTLARVTQKTCGNRIETGNMSFTESIIEQAAIDWLKDLGYTYAFGPEIAFDGETPKRGDYQETLMLGRLQEAIARINPNIPAQAQEEALRKITRLDKPSLLLNNHAFHHMLVNGIEVEYKRSSPVDKRSSPVDKRSTPHSGSVDKAQDGRMVSGRVYVVDFENIENNDWLVVNQYTVEASHQNGKVNRRPDVVIFINGLPLAVIELKNATDEKATIWSAFNQLQTYKNDIPALFHYNELLIISDGLNTRIGSITGNKEWFLPWKTVEGETTAPTSVTQLEVLLKGVFEKRRFLDLIRYC